MVPYNVFSPEFILTAFLIFVRITTVIYAAPFLGSAFFPSRIKAFFALAVTVAVIPAVSLEGAAISPNVKMLELVIAILKEVSIGLAMGLVGLIIFSGIQMAGSFVSLQVGLSFANIVDPQTQNQNPVIGQILTLLGTLLFVEFDGHATYLRAMMKSFNAIPVGLVAIHEAGPVFIKMATQIFVIGVQLSAPFIVVLFLLDVTLAIFARIMPQANIFFISMPLKVLGGLLIFQAMVPKLGIAFGNYFKQLFKMLAQLLEAIM
jgi:flagellar biosynthetic protein FliR